MPDLTATSTGFDDGYTARFESGYNETTALAARNSTVGSFDNQSITVMISAHGVIFGRAYNYRSYVAFDMSGNDNDGASLSGNTVTSANLVLRSFSNLSGFVTYTAQTSEKFYAVKSNASTNFDGTGNYNDIDGWVSSGTYDGNVTDYGNASQAANAAVSFTLNSTAITDINSAISSGGIVKMAILTEDDFLSTTGGSGLGTMSSQNLEGARWHTTETSTSTNRPKLELTYGTAASGYSHDVMGVASGNISTVKGVATADIAEVIGV